jgi:septal ring factor EnvC (AmiA/AmiB activator)
MDGDELSVLREENRKLVGSIKRLNVDLQTMKSQHLASVNESERMRDQLNEQNSSLNKVLDMMHSEKQSFIQ